MSTEKSEKVPVTVDNFTIKFPNKHVMDKIIEYINFETSNKYTLILNHAPIVNSRPNTREKSSLKSSSSPNRKHSVPKNGSNKDTQGNPNSKTINPSERKSAKQQQQQQTSYNNTASLETTLDLNKSQNLNDSLMTDNPNNSEIIDQVLTKVLTDDEAMIIELRNSVRSRNSLRSKHLAQLEESKEKLNEIKAIATQKLVSNTTVDQEFPTSEDESNNKDMK